MSASTRVEVIGAGLSGLATAWYLSERGARVHVREAGPRAGGLIQTVRIPEGLIETAARAFTPHARVSRLFDALGLAATPARDDSRRRYIFRGGRPRRWPLTPLESAATAARFGVAWISRRIKPRGQESVADWGGRVFGRAATAWLLGPALQGIYAAPPAELSATALFGKGRAPRGTLVAPERGMGALINRLQEALETRGVTFEFDRAVGPEDIDRSIATVICTSAPVASRLLVPHAPALAAAVGRIRMVSVVAATAFYPPHPADVRGFGVLFPRSSGVGALGVVFNADVFPGRSELRSETWIYGDLDPQALPPTDADVAAAIDRDRRILSGRPAAPVSLHVTRQMGALPVYDTAVLDAQAALDTLPPYLTIAGNYLGRLGVSSLLAGAEEAAARLHPATSDDEYARRAQRACEGAARGAGAPASDRAGVRGGAPV